MDLRRAGCASSSMQSQTGHSLDIGHWPDAESHRTVTPTSSLSLFMLGLPTSLGTHSTL